MDIPRRPDRQLVKYRRPTYKCEDAINANANFYPGSQLLNSQLTYYIRGDESRRAQNAIIEFAISLKTRKRNLFTTHLNVGLWYSMVHYMYYMLNVAQCHHTYMCSASKYIRRTVIECRSTWVLIYMAPCCSMAVIGGLTLAPPLYTLIIIRFSIIHLS